MDARIKNALAPYTIIIGLLPAISATITIYLCYHYTVTVHHHLPDWLWMPVISLLGCTQPESFIYQIGFGLTGLSTLLFFFTFQTSILSYIPSPEFDEEKAKLKWTVLAAAIGVFGQGVINMEESAIQGITNTKPSQDMQWQPGTQSIIHQLLAAIFFMSAMFHGWTAITVYNNCKVEPIKSMKLSKYFKIFSFGFPLMFQIFGFLYHPISAGSKSQNELNKAGLAQWITVFCYLAFFASYSIDHCLIQNRLQSVK